ncbi:MAG: DUF503 domain-containing protein [Anaerolineaceae bacterium]|nr:DUF503 domain-containing protein [Anaerolineaceae bacterium]
MVIGILHLKLQLQGCNTLKEKRSILKSVLSRLHKEFNLSVSETGLQDHWRSAEISCCMVGNDRNTIFSSLQAVNKYFANMWPDLLIIDDKIEIL